MIKTIEYSLESLERPISVVKTLMQRYTIFLLHGDIGTGKTTFMRALLESLGVPEPITSPTFTYVNQYYIQSLQATVYHFDLYRLASVDEFYELGLDYCFQEKSAFFFIEWPERIFPLFETKNACCLYFQYISDLEKRHLVIKAE